MSGDSAPEFAQLRQENEKLQELLRQSQRLRRLYDNSVARLKAAEQQLAEDDLLKEATLDSALDCLIGMDREGNITAFNPMAEKTFGYRQADVLGKRLADVIVPPSLRQAHTRGLADALAGREGGWINRRVETTAMRADGSEFPAELSITRVSSGENIFFSGFVRDISERKKVERISQSVLMLSNLSAQVGLDELMTRILDEIEALTGSCIGFFHFVEDDQVTVQLQNWSTNTLQNMCTAEGKGRHYPIDQAGVWVDCVAAGKPIIHNDYAALAHKKGTPEGHAKVVRELTVPVIRGDKVRAILGVGNKPTDYDDSDVQAASRLVDLIWDMVMANKTRNQLVESEQRLRDAQRIAHVGSWQLDNATNHVVWSEELFNMLGLDMGEPVPDYTEHHKLFVPESWERLDAALRHTQESGVPYGLELEFIRPDGAHGWMLARGEAERDDNGAIVGLHGVAMDITARKEAEVELQRHVQEAEKARQAMLFMLEDLNASTGEIERAKRDLTATFDAVTDPIFLHDDQHCVMRANLAYAEAAGMDIKDVIGKPYWQVFPKMDGPLPGCVKAVAAGGKVESSAEEEIHSSDGRIYLSHSYVVNSGKDTPFFAVHVVRDITESRLADDRLRNALEGTISVVSRAVEARDPYISGHQLRVSDLSAAIAREMGLEEERIEGIRMGARIHDIGKIHLPAEILSKPSKLSEMEFNLIKSHPQVGYDILKDIAFPWPVADIAYQHHERLDGSGYPQGLKDDAISLEARIVAVADVVEAMASHRPYRPGQGIEAALREVESHRGSLFDAEAVDACLQLFRSKGYTFDY